MEGARPARASLATAFRSPRISPPLPPTPRIFASKRGERGYSVPMEVGPSKPGAPASMAGIPAIGEVFAQKYRLERGLGRGAMGAVFAAEHVSLRQRVVVKFLLPHAITLPGASARFLREARAAAAIRSEHVARVIDVGTAERGIPYIVMEYLRGRDLQQEIEARGPLPVSDAVDYVIQGCEAVAEAHARGIIHRDLKPGNLFLTTGANGAPIVKVLDFGLSKSAAPEDDGKLTASEMMLGSPCYMSPEQVRCSKHVDARTDIWSIGVVLYQLLTARFPFEPSKISALFVAIATQAPTPPRVHRMDLPARIEDIILRCLEKEPELRVQTVAELARELARFGTERSARALAQIEAIAAGRAFPSLRPATSAADGVATTLPAAAAYRQGMSTTLPQPDADELVGSGAGSGRATAVASGVSERLTTLRSEGTPLPSTTSTIVSSSERSTPRLVPIEGGRSSNAVQDESPTLEIPRDNGPSPGTAPDDGLAPEGPTLTMARGSGLTLVRAQDGGPRRMAEGARAPASAMASEESPALEGPTLTMARGSGLTLARAQDGGPRRMAEGARAPAIAPEDGPTLAMARDDSLTLAMAPEDGPTLAMARDDSPTLAMVRMRPAPLAQHGGDERLALPVGSARAVLLSAPDRKVRAVPLLQSGEVAAGGGARERTERRRDPTRSSTFRWRRSAGAWIAAATALLVVAAFGASYSLGSAGTSRDGHPPLDGHPPSEQGASSPFATSAGPAPFVATLERAPVEAAGPTGPTALAPQAAPAAPAASSSWALDTAAPLADAGGAGRLAPPAPHPKRRPPTRRAPSSPDPLVLSAVDTDGGAPVGSVDTAPPGDPSQGAQPPRDPMAPPLVDR
ncbi:protein kinase domain-containing protein [Sorangium sp. So ce1000]|uniref:serine/threonine-protein kinase n=1 Tax=Sorangium sp. So ce1000 TaxID=3133325 RepID=UPI003F61551D